MRASVPPQQGMDTRHCSTNNGLPLASVTTFEKNNRASSALGARHFYRVAYCDAKRLDIFHFKIG